MLSNWMHLVITWLTFTELRSLVYHTNHFGYDCLYSFPDVEPFGNTIEYCINPSDNTTFRGNGINNNFDGNYTFGELHRLEITADEILLWSSSIDLAEKYQTYINEPIKSYLSHELFLNCTLPWFGSWCQYSFQSEEAASLTQSKAQLNNIGNKQTCYVLLKCDRGSEFICLDWREICDGRIDCLNDGIDESECFNLEINECKPNEYRCRNGLCIESNPNIEDFGLAECLDASDFSNVQTCPASNSHEIFQCEDYTCSPVRGQFSCGDGQCVEDFDRCESGRDISLLKSLSRQGEIPDACWKALVCLTKIMDRIDEESCDDFLKSDDIMDQLKSFNSPIEFPVIPVLYGHVRFLYDPKDIVEIDTNLALVPQYICFDEQLCDYLTPTFRNGTLTCLTASDMGLQFMYNISTWKSIIDSIKPYFQGCFRSHHYYNYYHSSSFRNSSLYQCKNSSKYISFHRIVDGLQDCPSNDDELAFELSCSLNDIHRRQCSNTNKCPLYSLEESECDSKRMKNINEISFSEICDGFQQMLPVTFNGRNHTDETDCEQWPCNDIFVSSNNFCNCPNGTDENNPIRRICDRNSFACLSPYNNSITCLPPNRVNDKIVDCLGASDELQYCSVDHDLELIYMYRCFNSTICLDYQSLCDDNEDCPFNDDEQFCNDPPFTFLDQLNDEQYIKCQFATMYIKKQFSLDSALIFPISPTRIVNGSNENNDRLIESNSKTTSYSIFESHICHRGIYSRLQNETNNYINVCFCPPYYYGDLCQYQSQRVSLTLTLEVPDEQILYTILITLIEDDNYREEIHSYHQLTQLSKVHCGEPIYMYLLYSSRPKNSSASYAIRVDAFDKSSFKYFGSWHLDIPFSFLPVNRIHAILTLPAYPDILYKKCNLKCYQGSCTKYLNKDRLFCKCFPGWYGAQCDIPINCSLCSSESLCAGSIRNRSLCVCPVNRFGSRCLLKQMCPIDFCKNNGSCTVISSRMHRVEYGCICSRGFYGNQCEKIKSTLEVLFDDVPLPSYIIGYFYNTLSSADAQLEHKLTTFYKPTILPTVVTLYSIYPYNMAFLKLDINYYLAVLQKFSMQSILTSISHKQRCPPINELLPIELKNAPWIQRVKYYHAPCQAYDYLQCFVDEYYMCLCTDRRRSNCFRFDHNNNFICKKNVYCENGGTCLQDHPTCSYNVLCICTDCFFGNRCQYFAKGIGLTLDDILRYVVRPNLNFNDQSYSVKLGASLTAFILIIGLLNSGLASLVFHHRNSRKVGCGLYLFATSIVSGITVIILTIKFWFVVLTYTNQSIKRTVLRGGCLIIEPILKTCLHTSNWLNAFIAIERGITVYQGIHFNKARSKHLAKRAIILLPFIILLSISHEFVFRDLFDDQEDNRVWCVMSYSSSIQNYSRFIQLFHFLTPFCTNIFSALFIIFTIARQQKVVQTRRNYRNQLQKQFRANKQLIISPIGLVILSIPHFLISILSGCIKASRDPWLYLSGYYISFIPCTFVFFIFVLPSNLYRRVFKRTISDWRDCYILF